MTTSNTPAVRDDSCYMAPLHLAGRIILENGGETYRVEETITRMGHAFGFTEVESFAVPSGIFISYRKSDGTIETAVKRVRKGPTNLRRVDAVNAVSRQMEQTPMSCDEVMASLREIEHSKPLTGKLATLIALALSTGGWAIMFGGGVYDFIFATLVGAVVQALTYLLDMAGMRSFVTTLACSLVSTMLPMLLQLSTGLLHTEATVAACLMPLLPGLAMTNAVQDTMRGDMLSGIASAVNAILTASMIAGGALIGTSLIRLMTGGAVL